jgi:hypothetical protein
VSEKDIREYVKKRKISGSIRSDQGRRCRDTLTSLHKTSFSHHATAVYVIVIAKQQGIA